MIVPAPTPVVIETVLGGIMDGKSAFAQWVKQNDDNHASLPGSSIWACRVSCRHAGALKFMRHLLQCLEGTKSNDGPAVAALDAGQKGKGTGPSQ